MALAAQGGLLSCIAVPRAAGLLPARRVGAASFASLCAVLTIVHCLDLRGAAYAAGGVLVHLCVCLALAIGNGLALLLSFIATEALDHAAAGTAGCEPGAGSVRRGKQELLLQDEEASGLAEGYNPLLPEDPEAGGEADPSPQAPAAREHGWRDLVRLAAPQRL